MLPTFTPTQTRIAEEIAAGKSHREIAGQLGISIKTVRNHLNLARRRARKANLDRYARALSAGQPKPVRFKPFSLLASDPV